MLLTADMLSRRRGMITGVAATLVYSRSTPAKDLAAMKRVVLLGDSVFDNAAYVGGGPDVVTQLRQRLPPGWRASLLAVDGSVIASIAQQLARLPADASHLVISVGGNDALGYASVLDSPSRSVADSLAQLAVIQHRFQADYAAMLGSVLRRGLPTALCSIYDPRYPDPARRRVSATALAVINDPSFARRSDTAFLCWICAGTVNLLATESGKATTVWTTAIDRGDYAAIATPVTSAH